MIGVLPVLADTTRNADAPTLVAQNVAFGIIAAMMIFAAFRVVTTKNVVTSPNQFAFSRYIKSTRIPSMPSSLLSIATMPSKCSCVASAGRRCSIEVMPASTVILSFERT